MTYYTTLIILCLVTLFVLSVLVFQNNRINDKEKKNFYIAYILIALAAISEWTALQLSGKPEVSKTLLTIVKAFDYILTPLAGSAFVLQTSNRTKWNYALIGTIGLNTIFQIVSIFTGWMIVINPDYTYSHGPLHFVYMILCGIVILLVIIEYIIYGLKFSSQHRFSLFLIAAALLLGIILQEALKDVRTVYVSLTMSALLLFIYYFEFSQTKLTDRLEQQRVQIVTDYLTGLLNRTAYSDALRDYENKSNIPNDFVVFLIDINGLKVANDKYGHEAGDELIKGAADCLKTNYSYDALIFRIGGDEFVVFKKMPKNEALLSIGDLHRETEKWHGKLVDELSVSVGYAIASDHKDLSCEELVKIADQSMYESKSEYYKKKGIDRRRY